MPPGVFSLKKGHLAPGYDADVILINPRGQTAFTNESMHYKCGWTPYHGTQVPASIRSRGPERRNSQEHSHQHRLISIS